MRAAVATAGERLGRLTAVVNVAGIGGYTGDIGQTSLADWARTLAVNLSGTFHVCRAALPLLRASGGGRIVTVSSQYGLVGGAGSPAYSAAKAGVIGLTRAMAVDHAAEGIGSTASARARSTRRCSAPPPPTPSWRPARPPGRRGASCSAGPGAPRTWPG